ncbi:MAG TPA: alginate O-acetyltransferase AlgF [Rhodanobacteraceae bacterium]|nr:alginate O-acetyltransferase AlgF [Rhodanobacteraceae bacterium]
MNGTTFALRTRRAFAAISLVAVATTASAGLYPPAAPPGSAFVRVFNGTTQPKISAQIGDKSVGDTAALEASPYIFLAPGTYTAKIGSASSSVPLQGSKCYTAALEQSGVHLFEQDCFNSQLKALVSVFNLVDGANVSLKTADGSQGVVENVAANASGHREVNPVKASLALYNGATKLADAKPVTLERGKTYSLFVTGSAAQPALIWSVN